MSDARSSSSVGKIARRSFLVAAGVVGGGLLVGAGAVAWRLGSIDGYKLPAGEGEQSFGAWLRLARDGKIEVVVPHQDMGQGIYALAVMLTAEGLKLPLEAVRAVPAPIEARFANPVMLLDGLPFDEAVEGPIAMTSCIKEGDCGCVIEPDCSVKPHWPVVNAAVRGALAGVPLTSLVGAAA